MQHIGIALKCCKCEGF